MLAGHRYKAAWKGWNAECFEKLTAAVVPTTKRDKGSPRL